MTPKSNFLLSGLEALKGGRYSEAIELLTMCCQHSTGSNSGEYIKAQMGLAQAYHRSGQLEQARTICQQLAASSNSQVQAWGKQALQSLFAVQTTSTTREQEPTRAIELKTLSEFKSYCQKNLIGELKKIEKTRQEILKAVTVSAILLIIIEFFAFKLALASVYEIKAYYFDAKQSPPMPSLVVRDSELTSQDVLNTKSPWQRSSKQLPPEVSLFLLFVSLLLILGALIVWVVFYSSCTETYGRGFKTNVIQKILEFIDPDKKLSYEQYENTHALATMTAFKQSQLFQNPGKLSQSDRVSGTLGETRIVFSDICAEIELHHPWLQHLNVGEHLYYRYLIGRVQLVIYITGMTLQVIKGIPYVAVRVIKGQRIKMSQFNEEIVNNEFTRQVIFKGLFFQANFNKSFPGTTTVLPSDLGAKLQPLNQRRVQLVKLEDPEFSRLFTVYGRDQVEARYILSTSLMSRLVNFRKKAGRKVYVSFVQNQIYIAIPYQKDLFEPLLFKNMLDFKPLREYFENLQLAIGIVEDLNLNRRIWG